MTKFPSPLEVDRQLYLLQSLEDVFKRFTVSVPSRGRQGLYVFGAEEAKNFYYVFPAPSEVDRGLYEDLG